MAGDHAGPADGGRQARGVRPARRTRLTLTLLVAVTILLAGGSALFGWKGLGVTATGVAVAAITRVLRQARGSDPADRDPAGAAQEGPGNGYVRRESGLYGSAAARPEDGGGHPRGGTGQGAGVEARAGDVADPGARIPRSPASGSPGPEAEAFPSAPSASPVPPLPPRISPVTPYRAGAGDSAGTAVPARSAPPAAGDGPAPHGYRTAPGPAPYGERPEQPATPGSTAPRRTAEEFTEAAGVPAPAPEGTPPGRQMRGTGLALPASDDQGPPVLVRGSRASREPWRLPAEPGPHGLAADEAALGGLTIRAASVIGPGHRAQGRPRQDAYRIGRDRAGEHLVIAVADGMSDSAHSDVGAQVAVSALVNSVRASLDAGTPLERLDHCAAFLSAAGQMIAVAEQRDWDPDTVRAVAVVAVVPARPHVNGRRRVWLASIADVSAWRLSGGDWERLIGEEKHGFDPSAVARYLPHDPRGADHGVVELSPTCVLAVTTDGVADAFATGLQARRWFAERWARPPAVGTFLNQVGFDQVQMHDDRTAVVVWCDDEEHR
ncbi:protein phosphatase 2C domain-containing protein [Streptomyces bobili]|uniref:protein phosphatase 2C domain-containing protein n=1 Tax=Streptomyces bobili TaxID=67280 RepID=UPI00382B2126